MWEESLKKISEIQKLFNEYINDGCNSEQINVFSETVKKRLGVNLPTEYYQFLSKVNGIEFNGYIIYGIDQFLLQGVCTNQPISGFIEMNELWYENEWQRKYIFFGENGISWFVYDKELRSFMEIDNPSGEQEKKFKDFYEMIQFIFENSLE